ncbi:MAG: cupin domain-containing protein [Pseudomonadota bacterium]|nr:cupin domain-containing protein [Pseudomonadota bacterium]
MPARIRQFDASAEYYFEEGCYINELSNTADDPAVSIAQARVKPGVVTRWHRLRDTVERYVILSGTGRVEAGDLPPQEVRAGAVVVIPPLCRQRIANIGNDDLVFLAICSPRFRPEVYEDLEEG